MIPAEGSQKETELDTRAYLNKTVMYSTASTVWKKKCRTIKCGMVQYIRVFHQYLQNYLLSAEQYSTVQYSTVKYSTVQYSTVQLTH